VTADLSQLSIRQLQLQAARVLAAGQGWGNHDLVKFNKCATHDSHAWYRAVITWYIATHGDLPSRVGPGAAVKLLLDDDDV